MTYYILSVISFTCFFFFYLLKTKKWSHLTYYILFIIILTGIFFYALKSLPYTGRGSENSWIYKDIILFFAMLLGMLTNTLTSKIKNGKLNIRKVELLKPLFAAPIVFMFVWGAIEKMVEFNFITCCFAYTNGYFWETILKKVSEQIRKD